MSLLSDTQGRPERVGSLLRLMKILGGRALKTEIETWMMPEAFREKKESIIQIQQTIGCARSLRFVHDDGDELVLEPSVVDDDSTRFEDRVHARLRDEPADQDRVMLLAYACAVLRTEREKTTDWLKDQSASNIATQIGNVLKEGTDADKEGTFNPTRYPYWRGWMVAMGLGYEARPVLPSFFPQPAERLACELNPIAEKLGKADEISAAAFLDALAVRMPYLDGGALFNDVAGRLGYQPEKGRVGVVLSEALRDLHDDERIELVMRADSASAMTLAHEAGSAQSAFVGIVIHQGRAE